MIKSYKNKETERFASGRRVKEFSAIEDAAHKKLAILDAATKIEDLRFFPGNRLEALIGKRVGEWSIRINDRWRLCFKWSEDNNAEEVSIEDYH